MGFPGQEYWNGLPIPSPRALPNPGIEPVFPALTDWFFPMELLQKPSPLLIFPYNKKGNKLQSCILLRKVIRASEELDFPELCGLWWNRPWGELRREWLKWEWESEKARGKGWNNLTMSHFLGFKWIKDNKQFNHCCWETHFIDCF